MANEITYMLAVVAAGFAVNFGLRALPFVIFGSRRKDLPAWTVRFGDFVSPVIIACLIVYSYSGLAWHTIYPYLAGALTVGLQLWRRNPLVSIVAGTLVYIACMNCGCTTHRTLELDAQHPAVRVAVDGVLFGDEYVQPQDVAELLEDYDVPHDRVIHILLDPEVKDLKPARFLMGMLARSGYTRPVLVTKRHAESENLGKRKSSTASQMQSGKPQLQKARRQIRYKRSNEE